MAQTYVTKTGDTLWSIAQQFYGDGNQWQSIHNANHTIISDPNVIHSNLTLTIPDATQPTQTYVTQAGDTLWSIAQRFYGDGARWPAIYQANTAAIGANPDVVTDGLTLTIPS